MDSNEVESRISEAMMPCAASATTPGTCIEFAAAPATTATARTDETYVFSSHHSLTA
jgi:hypothetical protein